MRKKPKVELTDGSNGQMVPMVRGRTFGQDLRRVREDRRLTLHHCAHIAQTSEGAVRAWEAGEEVPSRAELGRLTTAFRCLKLWKVALTAYGLALGAAAVLVDRPGAPHDRAALKASLEFLPPTVWPPTSAVSAAGYVGGGCEDDHGADGDEYGEPFDEEAADEAALIAEAIEAEAAAAMAPASAAVGATVRHETFGLGLLFERTAAGLTQEEVGKLLSVTNQSVSCWELDLMVPIAMHYEGLLGLFPGLALEPKPAVQNIDKYHLAHDATGGTAGGGPGEDVPEKEATVDRTLGARLTFGQQLMKERIGAGLERLDLAHRLNVSRRVVQGWELCERLPIPQHLARLLVEFPTLKPPDLRAPLPPPPVRLRQPRTFGEALKLEREYAGMHRSDLAKALHASHVAVRMWEIDRCLPSAPVHVQLCEMFPRLTSFSVSLGEQLDLIPAEVPPMAVQNQSPMPASPASPASPVGSLPIGGLLSLLSAVRRVETCADSGKMTTLLLEAERAGIGVSDLLRLLSPQGT